MSNRHVFALMLALATLCQVGCTCITGGCGLGGQAYNCGCASCGVADTCCDGPSCGLSDSCCGDCASCGCPDASCCCPDATCGCPDGCGGGVGCGSPVCGRCPLLARIRKALNCDYLRNQCSGCGGRPYCSEWNDSPPCSCESCDCYGNHTGGNYGGPHGRRAQLAKRHSAGELRFEEESGPVYR